MPHVLGREGGGLTQSLSSQSHMMPWNYLFLIKTKQQIKNHSMFPAMVLGDKDLQLMTSGESPSKPSEPVPVWFSFLRLIVFRPITGFFGHVTHGFLSTGVWQGRSLAQTLLFEWPPVSSPGAGGDGEDET